MNLCAFLRRVFLMNRARIICLAAALAFMLALLAQARPPSNLQPSNLQPSHFQNDGLTIAERRGQQIYRRGTDSSGQSVTAVLGDSGVELPAPAVACINCHGRDGLGKTEGGVTASALAWEALTRPYSVPTRTRRNRPPYTEALFARALSLGLDSVGNKLHDAMPRYRMTREQITDLIAYLKKLGKDLDPGLSDTSITIGTTLITDGRFREMSQSVRAALAAYFDDINRRGGVFNRRIVLQPVESSESQDERVKAFREAIERNQLFAFTSAFMAGRDEQLASLVREKEIPLIGAFTLNPQVGLPLNQYAFYIYPGLVNQAQALAVFAIEKYMSEKHSPAQPRAAIVCTDERPARDGAEAINRLLREYGWNQIEETRQAREQFDAASLVQKLREKSPELVFMMVEGESQIAFIQQARKMNWNPLYFIPGQIAAREILESPAGMGAQVFLSLPTLPSDQTEDGAAEYQKLAESYRLPPVHRASQLTALASAKILVEALKRAGRDVSRAKLIEALEGLYQFKTGFTPSITFNPNRRVGSLGAYIVAIDAEGRGPTPVSRFIEPD
jgi:ABC-type branched-subunit amino acid transport system substrate-binding protein